MQCDFSAQERCRGFMNYFADFLASAGWIQHKIFNEIEINKALRSKNCLKLDTWVAAKQLCLWVRLGSMDGGQLKISIARSNKMVQHNKTVLCNLWIL